MTNPPSPAQPQPAWEHIRLDHAPHLAGGPIVPEKSLFGTALEEYDIGSIIRAAFCYGEQTENTGGAGGFNYELVFNQPIGQSAGGDPQWAVRVVVGSGGTIVTAFPIP